MKKEERKIYVELIEVLHANNMALEKEIERLEQQLEVESYPSEMEEGRNVLDEIEQEIESKALDNTILAEIEAASRQAELEEAQEQDDLFKDWTPPSYEDVVDPEFDRGYDMAYDRAIHDIIQYLQGLRNSK
tara:strand:- start:25 stop:420 length:396 start_codon:yes stop_codon:yes gene_type:complete